MSRSYPAARGGGREANVIAPNGHTVASQNLHRDAAAELLSQGGAAQNPGSPDAGAVTLERAVALAARQPHRPDAPTLSRLGSEWFAFTRTGPGGCRAASSTCYQSGPTTSRGALHVRSGERVLAVPQGTVVVQATSSTVTGTARTRSPDRASSAPRLVVGPER
jgi:hypothetical protein